MEVDLQVFGATEGKLPDSWADFFKHIDFLERQQKHEAMATAALRVLKALVWSADATALKAASHEYAYADVTMFIRNWGTHASEVATTSQGLKLKGENIADHMVQAKEKMKCFRCPNGQVARHLDSMCRVSRKEPFRPGPRGRQDREEDDRDRRGGFQDRKSSRDKRDNFRDRGFRKSFQDRG